jgi:hypothetical protein
MLRLAITKYNNAYKNFIDFNRLNKYNTLEKYLKYFITRNHKNVFKDLAIHEFNYDKTYSDLYRKHTTDILRDTPELYFSVSLKLLLKQKFIKEIYIWTEEYDVNVRKDILNLFGDDKKVNYICGNFRESIKNTPSPVTTIVLNDILLTVDIFNDKEFMKNKNLLLASYKYNYINIENELRLKISSLDKIAAKNNFIYTIFKPIKYNTL